MVEVTELPLRPLPGTDLQLSAVGLGMWALGGLWWGKPVPRDQALATIRAARDLGCNWVDTAPLYGHGHADTLLVDALGPGQPGVIVATKVGVRWDGPGAHARSDLSPQHIVQDIEASLRRLQRETLDVVQIHWPCEAATPLAESIGALQALVDRGLVRYFGVCNYNAVGLRAVAAAGRVACLQTPYSLLRREFEAELRQAADSCGVGVLAYEPLCRGLLTGKFGALTRFGDDDLRDRDDRFRGPGYLRALAIVSRLQLVAKRWGVPVAALALAWAARQPSITAVIAGAKSPEQVQANALAHQLLARAELPWPEVDRIAGAFRG